MGASRGSDPSYEAGGFGTVLRFRLQAVGETGARLLRSR